MTEVIKFPVKISNISLPVCRLLERQDDNRTECLDCLNLCGLSCLRVGRQATWFSNISRQINPTLKVLEGQERDNMMFHLGNNTWNASIVSVG